MKLLILSCNTGEGHNSAARAVQEYAQSRGAECDIKDALSFWSPEKSKFISKGHVFVYRRLPKLFGVGYRFEENHPPKDGDESIIYELVTKGCEALLAELEVTRPDAVICTHVFSAMMMTELRRKGLRIPTYFIATDYTCSPGVSETLADAYFIPHSALTEEFAQNGIPRELIVPSGIPVKAAFYERTPEKDAKKRLHLPQEQRVVLLMCGSMGCGPIKDLAEALPALLPENFRLVVITGSNRRLFKQLTRGDMPENMTVTGYTTRVPLYMDAASLIITKAGGLSSTEAAVKGLPPVFLDAVPGCETRNVEFFSDKKLGFIAEDTEELISLVCELTRRPEQLAAVSERLKGTFGFHAAKTIYECISENLQCKN